MGQEKKERILIASVLKPVDDTRMFGKIGMSLAKRFEVHIAGQSIIQPKAPSNIIFHPLPSITRLSFKRILLPWRVLTLAFSIRPSMLIITTHELLGIASICRALFRCAIVYDVQENYYVNILHTNAFPKIIRPLVAEYVRLKEWVSGLFIDHYLLAERAYEAELPFLKGRKYTVVENKVLKPQVVAHRNPGTRTKLLFSGTLAETTGVITAIEIAKRLHSIDAGITLTIIGYAPQRPILKEIKNSMEGTSYIRLIGGDRIVPHSRIVNAIVEADAGIIAYADSPATRTSVPTKLYEYLAYQLPIILINHKPWVNLCNAYKAAIVFDDPNFDPHDLYRQLQSGTFYTSTPSGVYWDDEEKQLLAALEVHLTTN